MTPAPDSGQANGTLEVFKAYIESAGPDDAGTGGSAATRRKGRAAEERPTAFESERVQHQAKLGEFDRLKKLLAT